MSKLLQEKINELFEATKNLMSLKEIKPYCEQFNEWVNTNTSYSPATLGTKLSSYGFYKKFKSIPLEQGKNAETVTKHDAEGNVKGQELKHYATILCGLNKEQWNERNQTIRSIERLENGSEIDPDSYLEITGKLLASVDAHELAVGLIAATGRRPHEIIARAKFTAIKDKPYHVKFEGQGKKRGETPAFEIPVLFPADFVIKALVRLRKEPSTQALLKEVASEFSKSETKQNIAIDNRRGQSLRRVVVNYFGDVGDKEPVLAVRHGDDRSNNKALRAAYAVLATERECKGSFAAKLLFASRILGHYTPKKEDDRALNKLVTTTAYTDYYVTKPVTFPEAPQTKKPSEKTHTIRASVSDFEAIKNLQDEWDLPNQQAVLSRLLEANQKLIEIGKELIAAKSKISQLENQVENLQEQVNQQEQETKTMTTQNQDYVTRQEFEIFKNQMMQMVAKKESTPAPAPIKPISTLTPTPVKTKSQAKTEPVDFSELSNADLWNTKKSGSAYERLRRSFEAICLYNDTVATGDNDRLAITNLALRELSGANGNMVGDWIRSHADEVITHNSKHGMHQPEGGDMSNPTTYYNRRHGNEKIQAILKDINQKFLDGVAIKM